MRQAVRRILAGGLCAALLGASVIVPSSGANAAVSTIRLLRSRVRYVFVIYQENRSFDSYFGTFPGAEGLYSHDAAQTPGFRQPLLNTDGTAGTIAPFRIGPAQFAADTDDIDHAHSRIVAKMDFAGGAARMDRFAMAEENKYLAGGKVTLRAKQMGELSMAHEDCDTIPLLWSYAKRFVLFDHIFQEMTGPSTPGNLSIIGAQTGESQALFHPDELPNGDGDEGAGVPVLDDSDPFWGSPKDPSSDKMPVNAADFQGSYPYDVQFNLTFPTLPLTLSGAALPAIARHDGDRAGDYRDIGGDVAAIAKGGRARVPWGWYEEGYGSAPEGPGDPVDAAGLHASYVTHHNGPQYFGYVSNNPEMRSNLHSLKDLWTALQRSTLPGRGVFYMKGGYHNPLGLRPANQDARVQKNFVGDDDHPGYSDAQISEAMVAKTVNAIVHSRYWKDSAIVLTWDDSEGDYDHVPPPVLGALPGLGTISDGPRVPLIVISPYAKTGAIEHAVGNTASVVKLVDAVFGLPPLGSLPDELRARSIGQQRFGAVSLGARDANGNGITDLLSAFDVRRLNGSEKPLTADYAQIDDRFVRALPAVTGYGCKALGIVPTDANVPDAIPPDFNPRPKTQPAVPQ